MDKDILKKAIEAMLFAYAEPLEAALIADVTKTEIEQVNNAVSELADEYNYNMSGLVILKLKDKYQMSTRAEYFEYVQALFKEYISSKLSQASLETLSIIAYRQPITRPEIEAIRGVNADSSVKNLLDRGLIKEAGRKDVIGKPIMFETTDRFLLFAGVCDLSQLPDFEEFSQNIQIEAEEEIS